MNLDQHFFFSNLQPHVFWKLFIIITSQCNFHVLPNRFQQIMRIFLTFMGNKIFVNLMPTSKLWRKRERERDYFYTVVKECDFQTALWCIIHLTVLFINMRFSTMLIQLMLYSSRSKVKSSLSTKLTKFSGHVGLRSKT